MIDIVTDLRPLLGAVRDQGARPTCLAFAASDAHAALRDGWSPLSCEFAFFHAHRRSGTTPEQGASLSSMLDALRLDGQPAESGWPYLDIVPADLAHWVPPTDVGPRFGRNGAANSCIIPSILAALDSGTPVLLLTMLSKSFYAPSNAGIVDPGKDENPDPALRHAVVAVGHGTTSDQTAILIRNSWGAAWGEDGHAWLTEKFLSPRLFATAILKEDIDVSSRAVAA